MGASQSTSGADGAGAGAGDSGAVKTSYYELLGVERTATQDEIKKAYRKRALELHPDRNYGDVDRATALFAEIQSAYQVLSDDNERAWYDAHEGDILRGGDGGGEQQHYEGNMRVTTSDDIARMMGKFRGNIDFSDSPNGFFGFVRETFEQLAREEEYAADYADVKIPDYPTFGHKDDAYDDVVRNFYSMWSGFATSKSFAWLDVYRLSDAPDRRTRRLMEKENKKFREDGIRDFNEAVRTLVAFVRKRDPRYTPNRQTDEDKAKTQRDARKAQAARSRAAHAAKLEQEELPSWATARPEDEEEEESEEEIEEEHYECVACHKTFKSERQYDAHEKSKKHQKAVQALKRKMQKDNAHLNLDEDSLSSGVVIPVEEDGSPYHTDSPFEEQDEAVDDIASKVKDVQLDNGGSDSDSDGPNTGDPKLKNKTPKSQAATKASSEAEDDDSEDDDDEYASRSDIEARLAAFRSPPTTVDTETPDNDSLEPEKETTTPKMGKAAQKRAKRAAKQAELDESDNKHKCQTCNAAFPSKTQLFQHIQTFGHATLKSASKGGGGGGGKKGKKK